MPRRVVDVTVHVPAEDEEPSWQWAESAGSANRRGPRHRFRRFAPYAHNPTKMLLPSNVIDTHLSSALSSRLNLASESEANARTWKTRIACHKDEESELSDLRKLLARGPPSQRSGLPTNEAEMAKRSAEASAKEASAHALASMLSIEECVFSYTLADGTVCHRESGGARRAVRDTLMTGPLTPAKPAAGSRQALSQLPDGPHIRAMASSGDSVVTARDAFGTDAPPVAQRSGIVPRVSGHMPVPLSTGSASTRITSTTPSRVETQSTQAREAGRRRRTV